jgi:glycosyltransferase involved in cell wall biosynthesis
VDQTRDSRGVRVVLDVRPLQDPERAPTTAAYLDGLLGAFDDEPLPGESFVLLLQSDLDDPTERFARLVVAGRRLLPPTRLLRSAALTVDPFLVAGASVGAGWRAAAGGATGTLYHATAGAIPLVSRLPTVVTLLDVAPWELRDAFQRGPVARFGQRLRAQLLRESEAVIVPGQAAAHAARRHVRIQRDRLRVIPLAPRPAFEPRTPDDAERVRLGLPPAYLVYTGRFDARQDLATLLAALADLGSSGPPQALAPDLPWPPRVLIVDASPDDRASLARAAARQGVGEVLFFAPRLEPRRLASLVAGARAAILPAVSESAGLAAIEAIAVGTPVVAAAVGVLPEIVAGAGILVEPRDPGRLAAALSTAMTDDAVHDRLAAAAMERATGDRRTWADVARETRLVYAEVAAAGRR